MLIKVVLPAPLVPMRPTTESASMAAFTPPAAVTAPKRFSRFLASRIAAISGRPSPLEERPQPLGYEYDHQQERRPEEHLPRIRREVEADGVDGPENRRAKERRHHAAGAGQDGDEDELAQVVQ